MKPFSLFLILVMFLCVHVHAHQGMIALFTDHDYDDTDAVIGLYDIRNIYLYYVRGYGPATIAGYQFRLLISSSDVLIMNPEFPPGTMAVGDVATCMQVVGNDVNMCTEWGPADAIYLGTIPVINYGEGGPFTISVVQPTAYDGRICVLRCEPGYPIHDVIGDLYLFNGSYNGIVTPTPPRLIGAETTTAVAVTVELTESVTTETAETKSNYGIYVKGNPGQTVPVSSATLEAGGASVVITISGVFVKDQEYTLRAEGVTDLEGYEMRAGTWGTEIDFTANDNVAVEETSWGTIKSMFRN